MSKMLNRKTNRKIKAKGHIEKDFDLYKFKDQMTKEMSRFKNKKTISNISVDNDYEKKYKQYVSEGFTTSTLMIITRMFSDSTTLPKELRNEYPLHSLLTKIARQLMMNELEIVYFSIYLDTFGWTNDNFDIIEHFIITGLSVKKYLNLNTEFIENFLSVEYPNILEKFNKWLRMQKDYHLHIEITPKDVNLRYNLLKRPFNSYCKNNFIDYNESVDRILHMSLPYGEGIKNQKLMYHAVSKSEIKKQKINESSSIPKIRKEKKVKIKTDKESKKAKKELKTSFKVLRPDERELYNHEKIKDLLNLKDDDNMNNSNNNNNINININNNHVALFKTGMDKPNTNFDNEGGSEKQLVQLINNGQIDNGNDKAKGQSAQINYNNIVSGFSTQNQSNLMSASTANFSNMNFNQLFNLSNANFGNYNTDFIKQSSEFNFNGARNTSGFDQGLFRRNSTQYFDGQDEGLNDFFFKPLDLKQNLSFGSLAGDFKGEPNILNINLPKLGNKDEDFQKQHLAFEAKNDSYTNTIGNNLNTTQSSAPMRKNLLSIYQQLSNNNGNK